MGIKKTNYIAKLENAVRERWGDIAADNPRKYWTEDLSEEYEQEVEELQKKIHENEADVDKVEKDGYVVTSNIENRPSRETCEACGKYSFSSRDSIYLARYGACYECYFDYIDGREERWENGWRPNNNED